MQINVIAKRIGCFCAWTAAAVLAQVGALAVVLHSYDPATLSFISAHLGQFLADPTVHNAVLLLFFFSAGFCLILGLWDGARQHRFAYIVIASIITNSVTTLLFNTAGWCFLVGISTTLLLAGYQEIKRYRRSRRLA